MTTALEGGEGSASRPGRYLPRKRPYTPCTRRLDGPQGRSGQVLKISPPTGIRSPDHPARSQSLCQLSYRAHTNFMKQLFKNWVSTTLKTSRDFILYFRPTGEGRVGLCYWYSCDSYQRHKYHTQAKCRDF
jgi:hypothetical protein